VGIAWNPRERYSSMVAASAAAPHASMPTGSAPGREISQKPSPPMLFMCG